jgi:hypothetical protein
VGVREDPKCTGLASQPDEETRVALEKAMAEVEAALARAKDEERARLKAEAALTEVRQALAAAQVEVEQERQALVQAGRAVGTETESTESPPTNPGEGGAERRVTFIVRLTVDARNQPRRTEIEHAQSGHKETFPGLDAQRLIAFMKACLSLSNHTETDDSPSIFDNQSG